MPWRIKKYRTLGDGMDDIRSRLRDKELHGLRYEDIVQDPKGSLSECVIFSDWKRPTSTSMIALS